MKNIFNLILILGIFSSCAHLSDQKYFFEIENQEGEIERSSIDIKRETLFFEDEELSHKSERKLHLKIASRVVRYESNGSFWVENTTYEKEGQEVLHALGYPELHEKMLFKMNASGEVEDVKGHDADSIFYLPPVLLPKRSVKINDTWEENFTWKAQGQPFHINTKITCRLVGAEDWDGREVFRINLQSVSRFSKQMKDIAYENKSEGYFLWDPAMSTVLFSESKATDEIKFLADGKVSKTHTQFTSRYLSSGGDLQKSKAQIPQKEE